MELSKGKIEANVNEIKKENHSIDSLVKSCSSGGLQDVIKEIKTHKIDVNGISKACNGMTPLYAAVMNDRYDIIKYLLEHTEADVNKKCTVLDDTPIFAALHRNDLCSMKILLDTGANLEAKDSYKYTVRDVAENQKKVFFQHFIEMSSDYRSAHFNIDSKHKNIYSKIVRNSNTDEEKIIALLRNYSSGFNASFFHPQRKHKSIVSRLLKKYDKGELDLDTLLNVEIKGIVAESGNKESSSLARRFHYIKEEIQGSVMDNLQQNTFRC